jgi:NADP-dependent 3-hydroxy acid dehydrogenase YdfG
MMSKSDNRTGNITNVAVITGASSGIGMATARELHHMGMKLVLTARSENKLEELKKELDAVILPGDITDETMAEKLLDLAVSTFGHCDVLINNAGIMISGDIDGINLDDVTRMVRVNVEAPYRLGYVFLRHFLTRKSGHLVNISSVLGTKIRPKAGAYAGTKHAIEALSESLRMELAGSGVQVSCIEPGLVMTGLHDHWDVHPKETLGITEPLQPEDIARCIRFILSQPAHVRIPKMLLLPGENAI